MDALSARGVAVDTSDQMPAHIVYLGGLTGRVCRGPDRPGGAPTLVRADDWLPPDRGPEDDAALAELALRFVAAYAPVGPRDLAYWSGLPAGLAGRAMELVADRLEAVATPAGDMWARRGERPPTGRPPARLLPSFDGALLGHRDRGPVLGGRPFSDLIAGSWIRPTALVGGSVVGTWRTIETRGAVTVEVAGSDSAAAGLGEALAAEVADVGRFLGRPARLRVSAATGRTG